MYFGQFNKKLSKDIAGVSVARQLRSNGHLIEMTVDQVVTIDKEPTEFSTIEEARQYIKTQKYTKKIEEQAKTEVYDELSDNKIANIIKEEHNVKVTDTLIESYIELASSKLFTVDPVVQKIRNLNKLDKIIEGKIDFKLEDGSIVAITESTYNMLHGLLGQHQDVIDYMRMNKDNFIETMKHIGE